jgi:hypothetical protein
VLNANFRITAVLILGDIMRLKVFKQLCKCYYTSVRC